MKQLWVVLHDIWWRCRWGTSLELTPSAKKALKDIYAHPVPPVRAPENTP